MKRMICKGCGGVLKEISNWQIGIRWRCEYCGSEYIPENPAVKPTIIEVRPARCEILKAGATMSNELLGYIGPTGAKKIISRNLADALAIELVDKMNLIEEEDPATMTRRYTASIRIYQSEYKF